MTSEQTGVTKSGVAWSTLTAFYEADQRRRDSEEVEFGQRWLSIADPTAVYAVSVVVDTAEVYLTRTPPRDLHVSGSGLGDFEPVVDALSWWADRHQRAKEDDWAYHHLTTVEIVATHLTRLEADTRLDGWEEAMRDPDGIQWVRDKMADL